MNFDESVIKDLKTDTDRLRSGMIEAAYRRQLNAWHSGKITHAEWIKLQRDDRDLRAWLWRKGV